MNRAPGPARPTVLPLLLLLFGALGAPATAGAQVPSPKEFFGVRPGTSGVLITWDRLVDYYRTVGERSPRVDFSVVGRATEGNPFVMLLVSSPENLARAEEYRQIQQKLADPRTWESKAEKERLIEEGRVVVMQNAAIHATEVGGHQAPANLLYELATSDEPEILQILENVIIVMVPGHNPDGTAMVTEWWNKYEGEPWRTSLPFLYQKYVGHDNNRDWYTFFQQESRLTLEVHNAWHPQVVLDQHQQGATGSRLFVPPFEDPYEPNVDPILISWLSSVGPFVANYMISRGLTGIEWGKRYDGWTPARAYHHYKGAIRVLTEVASANWADPITVPPDRMRPEHRTMHWNHPAPWPGGEWTFEDVVTYHHQAAKATMLFAANNRRQFLEGFAAYFERSLAYDGAVRAFMLRGDQENRYEVGELLDILNRAEVEIQVARAPLSAGGRRYPSGTYLIDIRQPYGRFAKAVLERQEYPDLRQYEGGPPDLPYDVTAHTLPLLMGVEAVPVDAWTGGDLAPAPGTRPPGSFEGGRGLYMAMSSANTGTIIAANRLRKQGIPVYWAERDFRFGERELPRGTVLVRNSRSARRALEQMSGELSLAVWTGSPRPALGEGDLIAMGGGRVGLIQSWFASMEAGWTEWLLKQYDVDYTIVRPRDLADPATLSGLEAIIVPGESRRAVVVGRRPGEMPDEYVGGAGEEGVENLRTFVEEGGALISWGGGNTWIAEAFGIGLSNGVAGLERGVFFIPGSILRGRVDTSLPVNHGLDAETPLWFRRGSALLFEEPGAVVLARYGSRDVLMSGWALGTERIRDHIAAGAVVRGRGAVVLFGFTPQYRAQTRNTMKMIFNLILGAGNRDGAARMLRAQR